MRPVQWWMWLMFLVRSRRPCTVSCFVAKGKAWQGTEREHQRRITTWFTIPGGEYSKPSPPNPHQWHHQHQGRSMPPLPLIGANFQFRRESNHHEAADISPRKKMMAIIVKKLSDRIISIIMMHHYRHQSRSYSGIIITSLHIPDAVHSDDFVLCYNWVDEDYTVRWCTTTLYDMMDATTANHHHHHTSSSGKMTKYLKLDELKS